MCLICVVFLLRENFCCCCFWRELNWGKGRGEGCINRERKDMGWSHGGRYKVGRDVGLWDTWETMNRYCF